MNHSKFIETGYKNFVNLIEGAVYIYISFGRGSGTVGCKWRVSVLYIYIGKNISSCYFRYLQAAVISKLRIN